MCTAEVKIQIASPEYDNTCVTCDRPGLTFAANTVFWTTRPQPFSGSTLRVPSSVIVGRLKPGLGSPLGPLGAR